MNYLLRITYLLFRKKCVLLVLNRAYIPKKQKVISCEKPEEHKVFEVLKVQSKGNKRLDL